ncbi:hypothetical protein FHX42_003909 [Saccharopolyspora lacisalsi]|uniref:Uncharacterized protein n=1 Tax=Halosaccharopolyspora lacisalsi TaxID=1000566 RepID=A0A839DZT3_9PSEU|nr:hypothetical protein [Halosaccharopolyspora lacisalsi]MBA8826533.1 hypothetical protein [Halosaccharopolyspora lacisalsi]
MGELSAVTGPLRRSLLRTTKRAEGVPPLQDATVELLRVVASRRVVVGALERMRQRDQEHLSEALPALRSLLAVLQEEDGQP